MIFQFKITLIGTRDPMVWRRIAIDSCANFTDLHYVIQASFGWDNAHLFEFNDGKRNGRRITVKFDDPWFEAEPLAESSEDVIIEDVYYRARIGKKMYYLYDFGDSWHHEIVLEQRIKESFAIPLCLDGGGACPPEDCGGVYGYYDMVDLANNSKSDMAYEYREWMGLDEGEKWDLNDFKLSDANIRLMRRFSR